MSIYKYTFIQNTKYIGTIYKLLYYSSNRNVLYTVHKKLGILPLIAVSALTTEIPVKIYKFDYHNIKLNNCYLFNIS